jgi:hypothetical protein
MRKVLIVPIVVLSVLLLFGCMPKAPSSDSTSEPVSSGTAAVEGVPSPGGGNSSNEDDGVQVLLVPYDISRFINRDLIFRGEIISVENVSSTLTVSGVVQDTYEESLFTVRVDEVYAGDIPGGKKEIVLYCPASNKNSDEYGHVLSPGKGYVFFTLYWNEELIASFDAIGYGEYGYEKRSDVYLPTNTYSLFIANSGYVIAQRKWAEVLPPPKPEPADKYEKLSPSLIRGYGIYDDLHTNGSSASVYTEEEFREVFKQMQELYGLK